MSVCQRSVVEWAERKGYEYELKGDEFWCVVGEDFAGKVRHHALPLSDLSRLLWARQYLSAGFDSVIWFDIDVLIFDAANFDIPRHKPFVFCAEVWPLFNDNGQQPIYERRINNSVFLATSANHLDFLIYASEAIAHRDSSRKFEPRRVGTFFLTDLGRIVPIPLINTIGIINPMLHAELCSTSGPHLASYRRNHGGLLHAANLCMSFTGKRIGAMSLSEESFAKVCELLVETRGTCLGRGD